jgi:hypothetical protein
MNALGPETNIPDARYYGHELSQMLYRDVERKIGR